MPYDCGLAIVADRRALRSTLGWTSSYLIVDDAEPGDPHERVPELSRRARGIPVWAVLRSLGSSGVAELIDGLARAAGGLAAGAATIPGAQVLNDVVFTQVSVAFETDDRTRAIIARLLADGTAWMSGSRWHGRQVIRISGQQLAHRRGGGPRLGAGPARGGGRHAAGAGPRLTPGAGSRAGISC